MVQEIKMERRRIENRNEIEESKRVGKLCEKKSKIRMKRKDETIERLGMSDRKRKKQSK